VAKKRQSDPSSSPRLTAIPAARSSAAVLKVRLILVLGSLLLAAGAGIFAAYSYITFTPPQVNPDSFEPRGQGLASMVAVAFLNGQELPIPVADEVPELPGELVPLPHTPPQWNTFESGTIRGRYAELHSFSFYRVFNEATPDEAKILYQLDVLVSFTDRNTPVLGALPSFQPVIAGNSGTSTLPNKDGASDITTGQRNALESWAKAWAANDTEELSTVAGAGTGYRYLGLGGFQSTGVQVLSLALLTPQASAAERTFTARTRVSLVSANGYETSMDMDVLLRGTGDDNVRAYVTAWGPAGSGRPRQEDVRVRE